MGVKGSATPGDPASARSDSDGSGDSAGSRGSGGAPQTRRVIGQPGTSGGSPPQGSAGIGIGMPSTGEPPATPHHPASSARPDLDPARIIDRRYEIVVVCGPRGVIVQPGGYRVTADALKDRDGLLKKQMVALVRTRRAADPSSIVEPKVRYLVQPGGSKTYGSARSQMLLSGLDWPTTTQVVDPDSPSILPSEGW